MRTGQRRKWVELFRSNTERLYSMVRIVQSFIFRRKASMGNVLMIPFQGIKAPSRSLFRWWPGKCGGQFFCQPDSGVGINYLCN